MPYIRIERQLMLDVLTIASALGFATALLMVLWR